MFINSQRDRYIQCYCTGACRSTGICPNSKGISPIKNCMSPEHNAPTHLYISPGKVHIHICPLCKNRIEVSAPNITY